MTKKKQDSVVDVYFRHLNDYCKVASSRRKYGTAKQTKGYWLMMVINMIIGGVAITLLLLPTIFM